MTKRITDLCEISQEPTFLKRLGFKSREEDTTDTVRSVCYEKAFQSDDSQVKLKIQVEFEKTYRDDPMASYNDNVTYSYSGVYLKVIDRQMDEYDDETRGAFSHYDYKVYNEESEKPRTVGRFPLDIQQVSQLRTLCKMLIAKQT
jgi:hypothetical protein